jgi:hypothetical protein
MQIRRAEAFAGVKLGVRGDRFGVFAKRRPGLTRLIDKGQECLGADCVRVLMLLAVSLAPPCPADTCTSHNVSTRFGVGVRF